MKELELPSTSEVTRAPLRREDSQAILQHNGSDSDAQRTSDPTAESETVTAPDRRYFRSMKEALLRLPKVDTTALKKPLYSAMTIIDKSAEKLNADNPWKDSTGGGRS